jgi:signal transduction histidine kinase
VRNAVLIALLVAALAVLAVLQYRWIGDVSTGDELRARSAMEFAARQFNEEAERELNRVASGFQRGDVDGYDLERRHHEWAETARDPRLIKQIWVIEEQLGDYPTLFKLVNGELVQPEQVPAHMKSLVDAPAMMDFQGRPGPARRVFMEAVPAIIVPIRRRESPDDALADGLGGGFPRMRAMRDRAFAVLELDRDYLTRKLFPDLVRGFFNDEYAVAVTDGTSIIYRSDPRWPSPGAPADAELNLFRLRVERPPGVPPEPRAEGDEGPPPPRPAADGDQPAPPSRWKLLVRRAEMPLSQAVAATRRRNLQISFAILALFAGSGLMLAIAARRAERLRKQQLEFVAGITHELNTPLAALRAAGQNLADGVVADADQTKQYGSMIVKEARRLADTVAQVLDYAGLQGRTTPLRLAPVELNEILDDAAGAAHWLATERGVDLEVNVPRELPAIDGDAPALSSAIKNLIFNAIRHGGEGGWVGVSAFVEGKYACIKVEDRGPGIAPRDLPHLFDAFYRGRGSDQVRGSGLGLTIVAQVAKAHGGSIEAERRRAQGAAFILKLPLAEGVSPAMERQHV